jgi:hypothetical protein
MKHEVDDVNSIGQKIERLFLIELNLLYIS